MYEIVAALSNTDRERISASRSCPCEIRTSEPAAVMYVRSSNLMRRPPVGSVGSSWSRHSIMSKYGADVAHAVSARPFDMEDSGTPCRSLKTFRMALYASSFTWNSFFSKNSRRMVGRAGLGVRCLSRPKCSFNLGGFAVRVGGARASATSLAVIKHRADIATRTTRSHRALHRRPALVCDVALICDRAASRGLLVTCANGNGIKVRGLTVSGDVERPSQSVVSPGRARYTGMVHVRRIRCRCRRSMRVERPSGIPGRSPLEAYRSRSRGEPIRSSRP